MKIQIHEVEQKTTATGKLLTVVKDNQGNKYSCWDVTVAQQLKNNSTVDVAVRTTVGKDGKEYNNITAIIPIAPTPAPATKTQFKRDPAESRLIVRQSSLGSAVVLYAHKPITDTEILALAEKFTAWVYEEKQEEVINRDEPPMEMLSEENNPFN